jgi:hypothetical protein
MWASLVLMTSLNVAPEPVAQPRLKNVRLTHNILGWNRKDQKDPKLYPGDQLFILFDIDDLTVSDDGLVKYSIEMELKDKKGKVLFNQAPQETEMTASLGGKSLAGSAMTQVGTDTAPGTYTLNVTVTDRGNKKSDSLSKTFDVVPPDLGFVRILVEYHFVGPGNIPPPAPPVAVPGQAYWVEFAAVGFKLDPKKMEPDLTAEMIILDESGKPVLKNPVKGGAKEAPLKKYIPMQFILSLNRPGKFKMVLKLTDNLAKKSTETELDFVVLEPK